MMKTLESLKKAGKIRFAGISTHSKEHDVIRAAIESKFYDIVLAAYNFRKENIVELDKAIAEAGQAGLGIIAMKTQAARLWNRRARQQPIPAKPALKWALQNPGITTSIPGMTTLDQLRRTYRSSRTSSSRTTIRKSSSSSPGGRAVLPGLQRLPAPVPGRAPDPRPDAELHVRRGLPELRRSL